MVAGGGRERGLGETDYCCAGRQEGERSICNVCSICVVGKLLHRGQWRRGDRKLVTSAKARLAAVWVEAKLREATSMKIDLEVANGSGEECAGSRVAAYRMQGTGCRVAAYRMQDTESSGAGAHKPSPILARCDVTTLLHVCSLPSAGLKWLLPVLTAAFPFRPPPQRASLSTPLHL